MVRKMAATIVLIIGSLIAVVTSRYNGAPSEACETLMPGHNPSTGENPSPFSVTVDPAMYGPGDEITVTITTSGVAFKGFIIQARKSVGTTPYGTFKDPDGETKLLTCTTVDSSWTHSGNSDKTSATATWTAPNADMGTLAFQATVVQQNSGGTSIFYPNIMSMDLVYNGPTGMPTMKGTSTPWRRTTTMTTTGSGAGSGAGMVRSSLIVAVIALLAIALVTRRL